MSTLRELQSDFMNGLFDAGDGNSDALSHIASTTLSRERRLAIYRNNVYVGLTNTLRGIYPVIQRLVGDDFFDYAAKHYIDNTPSISGDLNQYGEQFAFFLSNFPAAAELSYLPDVARLEWAYHTVYYAADHPPLWMEHLADVTPADYGELRFKLHPAARLVRSDYPIHTIWQVNQSGFDGDQSVDLAVGSERVLVQRRENIIVLEPLAESEWMLLSHLAEGVSLGETVDRLLNQESLIDPGIDLGALLQRHITRSVLV